jgi:hypothetical protein
VRTRVPDFWQASRREARQAKRRCGWAPRSDPYRNVSKGFERTPDPNCRLLRNRVLEIAPGACRGTPPCAKKAATRFVRRHPIRFGENNVKGDRGGLILGNALLVNIGDELEPEAPGARIAERDHFPACSASRARGAAGTLASLSIE